MQDKPTETDGPGYMYAFMIGGNALDIFKIWIHWPTPIPKVVIPVIASKSKLAAKTLSTDIRRHGQDTFVIFPPPAFSWEEPEGTFL